MVIDFHTHVFPEKIAENTIKTMSQQSHATAVTDGTLKGLQSAMQKDKIDYSVVLPVVTKPEQFETINKYAASINKKNRIYSFGGIHPDNDNITERLTYIKSLGLKGIKLHPDYQNAYIDDKHYIQIIKECIRLDLCCVIHAGLDIGLPVPIHCPPDRIYLMLQEVLKDSQPQTLSSASAVQMNIFDNQKQASSPKIILAHMGGYLQWQLVEELLVGQDVYFDLAFCNQKMPKEQLIRIIKNHGSHRILYATDSPWAGQKEIVDYVKSLPLSQEDIENILYKNAMKLLGI